VTDSQQLPTFDKNNASLMAIFGGYREEDLLRLDSSIRDWVVLPMVLVVVLVGIGRHYAQQLMRSTPQYDNESHLQEVRNKQVLSQAMRLRFNGSSISPKSFQYRKAHLIRKKTGLLREKAPPAVNPMSNPMAMMDMMKGNMSFMLPNIAMMSFVSNFFNGFVCLKMPFPLPSIRFKMMMQRGVDLSTLDVSYVSSLSWYFLLTFGLNGVYKLILGADAEMDDMQKQVTGL
jgi:ER membrane protein complex subunit 3